MFWLFWFLFLIRRQYSLAKSAVALLIDVRWEFSVQLGIFQATTGENEPCKTFSRIMNVLEHVTGRQVAADVATGILRYSSVGMRRIPEEARDTGDAPRRWKPR